MKLIQEIDILHNKKLSIILNILAIILWIIFFLAFTIIIWFFSPNFYMADSYNYSGLEGLWFLVGFVVLTIIHELIHGLFFKLFNPENKVKFGIKWKQGMAFATSPGSLYNRGQMFVISLAPFVLISLVLSTLFVLGWLNVVYYLLLVSAHAGGCIGDFYYAYLFLIKYGKNNILVEDTEMGLRIYQV